MAWEASAGIGSSATVVPPAVPAAPAAPAASTGILASVGNFFSGIGEWVLNLVGVATEAGSAGAIAAGIGVAIAVVAVVITGWNVVYGGGTCNEKCIEAGFEDGGGCYLVNLLGKDCIKKTSLISLDAGKASCAATTMCCCKGQRNLCKLEDGTEKECGDDGQGGSCGNCTEQYGATYTCNDQGKCEEGNESICDEQCDEWQQKDCGQDSCEKTEMSFTRTCPEAIMNACNVSKCEPDETCGGNETPPEPVGECDVGTTQCVKYDLYQCVDQGEGVGKWKLLEQKSLACAPDDGDFSPTKCSEKGGVWMSDAPTQTNWELQKDYCCGDDPEKDLGRLIGKNLCVLDGETYKWLIGAEKQRYLGNTLLFCENKYVFCLDNQGYSINAMSSCTRKCDFFCDVQNNQWTADSEYKILSEALGKDEKIDTLKTDLASAKACCPAKWCYDGKNCIEDQYDEACDEYVYTYQEADFRCMKGNWAISTKKTTWDGQKEGYCPSLSDCFVSCEKSENNYLPDKYFAGDKEKPQCIATGQYILDNACSIGIWNTRTSLIATKLIQIGSPMTSDNYLVYCDDYQNSLNEFSYIVNGKSVYNYLGTNCDINGNKVPCTNSFCILKTLGKNQQIIFGVSLNTAFDDKNGFKNLVGTSCAGNPVDEWTYTSCGQNVYYNPKINSVLFSNKAFSDPGKTSAWELFVTVLKQPIISFKNLIKQGSVYYVLSPAEARLSFPLLDVMPRFQKVYLMKKASKSEEGIIELDRYDKKINQSVDYMMVLYNGYPMDVCQKVNDFGRTSNLSYTTCFYDGTAYVAESTATNAYIMNYWQDFTSKFRP